MDVPIQLSELVTSDFNTGYKTVIRGAIDIVSNAGGKSGANSVGFQTKAWHAAIT